MKALFRMDAQPRLVYTASAGALVLVVALLLLARLVPSLVSVLAVVLLSVAAAAGLAAEVVAWLLRGIRSIELSDDTLTVFRGRSLAAQAVARQSVVAVRTVRRWGSRLVVLTVTGIRPGRRTALRIGEGAFPREQFSRFLTLLEAWRRG